MGSASVVALFSLLFTIILPVVVLIFILIWMYQIKSSNETQVNQNQKIIQLLKELNDK
ncbi:hypothetical protein [Sporosarcina sp. HYO08]|uniref:hypothetical protein n=1 Tax=Sporosarcina sp. HYO08 TaxID=1759557 RepID=UPI00155ECA41|nr:hypothetical protein [Sporosarcina sp. HYO08]